MQYQSVELALDRMVNLPRGFAYVEFEERSDAEAARLHLDGGQIDGAVISCASLFGCWGRACWRLMRDTGVKLHNTSCKPRQGRA